MIEPLKTIDEVKGFHKAIEVISEKLNQCKVVNTPKWEPIEVFEWLVHFYQSERSGYKAPLPEHCKCGHHAPCTDGNCIDCGEPCRIENRIDTRYFNGS